MGFTIADMMIGAEEKFDMCMIAGNNGWANSISWLLMVEDTTITKSFKGKELAVTTGLGFETEEKLLELVKILDEHHASGLIVNIGYYINDIPKSVITYCNSCDLPLFTVPWDVEMSEMIKDLTVRIFLQTQTDEQISAAFIKAIEKPYLTAEYREALSQAFDVDGKFQVVVLTTSDLDSMDSMDRKRVGYRLQIYLENISHNAHFFYYDGDFVLILNAVEKEDKDDIINGFIARTKRRMPDREVFVGEGTQVMDASQISLSYHRAVCAAQYAMKTRQDIVRFDEMGMNRLLYSVADTTVLDEMGAQVLKPLLEYDRKHNSELFDTFAAYLKNNGSVRLVSEEMFIHKNTIVYRMNKIKELLECDIDNPEERLKYRIACMIVNYSETLKRPENLNFGAENHKGLF